MTAFHAEGQQDISEYDGYYASSALCSILHISNAELRTYLRAALLTVSPLKTHMPSDSFEQQVVTDYEWSEGRRVSLRRIRTVLAFLLSEDAKSLHVESRKLLIIQECMNVLPRRQQVIARTKSVDRGAVGSNFLYKDAA